jgi:23S rRNA (cytosine1962-C5)-methyltransferase
MFTSEEYELLDFGHGRRLERFGELVLDRPCPAAEEVAPSYPDLWSEADARFVRDEGKEGRWISAGPLADRWIISHGPLMLELKRTEFGHLGVFPEQAANWDWLAEQLTAAHRGTGRPGDASPPLAVLNLFAHTGASTLTAAAAGAEVTHVDAARNVMGWARRNAELSEMSDAPIRWIAEDAQKFVRRELKRGNGYDAVILDPPSYGHGPRGEVWRLSKHLPELLGMCGRLTAGRRRFLLLTCHTPKFGPERLGELVAEALPGGHVTARGLTLATIDNRHLPSGVVVRWVTGG